MKQPLKYCANGDGRPVDPPSWVLCKECKNKIKSNLETMIDDLKTESTVNTEASHE